jgi:hypothetical protein
MNKNEIKAILKNNRSLRFTKSGIKGGSIGPLTCTDAHLQHNFKIEQEILNTLKEHGFYKSGNFISNGQLGFLLSWSLERTHKGKDALIYDPAYKTYYAKIIWMKTRKE